MDTQAWEEVKRLFGEALQMPPGGRRAWVERECGDEAVRREVLHLLDEYSRSEDFLENSTLALHQAVHEALEGPLEGRQIGPWRLVRQIGRGGMGVVFEAVREGEDFQARFALKLIRAGLATERLAERFRFERRVLASLSHPGIAALVDGGATADGLPYLVMEYVEGQPIDRWVEERKPPLRDRVRLMVEICDAVRHAHERLVIHRDLKPGNILVTPEGRPKLLDFGIAKLLDESGEAGPAQTATYVLTPEYASPEQITGAPVTTASDIYSLGVLLYVLLAGRRPYELAGLSPLEAMRRVLEAEPKPPGALAPADSHRLLRGDLDNIVMKCLRKNPAERYRTADALARDLEAWLEGRPVAATPPSLAYRLRKWAGRNRGEAAALAALLVSLLAGGLATAWQAHEAQMARSRAEQRALEIQKLSRALVFEINEALQKSPGSTEARALLLDRAMQFFDGAARTAAQDAPLLLDLAEGYRRLGNVMGSAFSDNLGLQEEALRAFEKGLAAVRAARRVAGADYAALRAHSGLLVEAALAAIGLSRQQEAEKYCRELQQVVTDIETRPGAGAEDQSLAAVNWAQLGLLRASLGPREESIRLHRRALALFETLPPQEAARPENLSQKAFVYKRLGALLMPADLAASEDSYREGLEIDRELLRLNPGDSAQRYNMTFALSDLGLIAKMRGDDRKSLAYFSEAAVIRDEFHAADPKNVRVLNGVINVHCQKATVLARLARYEEARREGSACETLARRLAAIEGERGCGRGPAALLFAAEAPLLEALQSAGARRARLAAEADVLITRAQREYQACAFPFPSYTSRLEEITKLRTRLKNGDRHQ